MIRLLGRGSESFRPFEVTEFKMADFDIDIIRPQMRLEDVKLERREMARAGLQSLKKALRAFHNLETMAVNIYKWQLTRRPGELNRLLIAAMANEMTHLQDFQVKLYEFGLKPSRVRGAYWLVGFAIGFFSRLFGAKAVLKAGIWVETKAVHHYSVLLSSVAWDSETRFIIRKDQADEEGHVSRWKSLLSKGQSE